MRRIVRYLVACFALVWLVGCQPDEPEPSDPQLRLMDVEAQLLAAERLHLLFSVTATGAIQVDMQGQLRKRDEVIELSANGTFASEPVSLLLSSANGTMSASGQNSGTTLDFEQTSPTALHEALIIGLTRMGILHNLARILGNVPPDHADGGAADWVQASALQAVDGGVHFNIVVDGQASGEASLFISENGWPSHREQEVHFPDGTMQVMEQYRFLD